MFYALVPLLLSSFGIFITPRNIRQRRGYATTVKIISVLSSFMALFLVLFGTGEGTFGYLFKEDSLSFIFSLLASFIGFLTVLFSTWYVEKDHREFHSAMLLFIASMIGLVLSDNIILLVVFWEGTTLMSFNLIKMKGTDEAAAAAIKVWIINQLGGVAMLIAAAYAYHLGVHTLSSFLVEADLIVTLLLFFAAITKSAVFPFHIWLPSAMEAHSPVSALLHSASMVMAGIYLLVRMMPLLLVLVELRMLLLLLGLLTILASSMRAFMEKDIKRILACSTLMNIGMVVTCISLATPFSIAAALLHIISHALFKSSLFLEAGVFEHSLKTRDINKLGSVIDKLPATTFFFILSSLSAMGVPITLGFLSKFAMYESALPIVSLFLLFGTVLAAGYYTVLLGSLLARGTGKRLREGWRSLATIAPLSIGSVLLAIYPYPITDICARAAQELTGDAFIFPSLLDPSMLYLTLPLFIGSALVFSRRRAVVPFRCGESVKGAVQTPSLQIYDIRKSAARVYSLLDVDVVYSWVYPAGNFVYEKFEVIHSLIEVK